MRHLIRAEQIEAILEALRPTCDTTDEACAVLIATYVQLAKYAHPSMGRKDIVDEISKAILGMRTPTQ